MTKKPARPQRPLPLRWEFAPDIPTYDFIKDHRLHEAWNLQDAVEGFIYRIEKDFFLAWEAVMAEEQGLPLTEKQEAALGELLDFTDDEDDRRVLYIDELPRFNQPWHVILNQLAPRLLREPFRTADIPEEVECEGWRNLAACLAKHGDDLSLPPGVSSPLEVVPTRLRHKLWLQDCFGDLSGLGQDKELTLANQEQHYRIEDFVAHLREHRDTVRYLHLTLDSLLERVILPDQDRAIFVRMMLEQLGMQAPTERLAGYLGAAELEEEEWTAAAEELLHREEQRLRRELEATKRETQRLLLEQERLKQEKQRLLAEVETAQRDFSGAQAKEQASRRQLAIPPSRSGATLQKFGRNDPCPCGSGKKFKKCCLKER